MEKQFCVQCGTELQPEDKFCPKCGAPVHGAAVQSRGNQTCARKRRHAPGRAFSLPLALAIGAGVLIILLIAFIALNPASPAPTANSLPEDSHDASGIPYPEVPRISLTDAKARFDAQTALFVDVRTQGEYDTAHIPNTVSLPLADVQTRYQELLRDREIITYCT